MLVGLESLINNSLFPQRSLQIPPLKIKHSKETFIWILYLILPASLKKNTYSNLFWELRANPNYLGQR